MKKVTVYLADETVEILDKLAQSSKYYKYPKCKAYGMLIDEMLLELQQIAIYSARRGFSI
jgi:hypothetical protein